MTVTRRYLEPGEVDHEFVWLAVGLLTLGLVVLMTAGWEAPRVVCVFKEVTGIPCAGCGTTRAARSLASGQIGEAFRLHPLLTLAAITWSAWGLYAAVVLASGSRRVRISCSPSDLSWLRWTSATAVVACWVFLILDGR